MNMLRGFKTKGLIAHYGELVTALIIVFPPAEQKSTSFGGKCCISPSHLFNRILFFSTSFQGLFIPMDLLFIILASHELSVQKTDAGFQFQDHGL